MNEIVKILKLKSRVESLPPLPTQIKKRLERKADIDHVYYSSALEGSKLTRKQVAKAVEKA